MNEVDGPDVVGVCGPQPDNGTVFVIKPPALLMAMGKCGPSSLNKRSIVVQEKWSTGSFFDPSNYGYTPAFHSQQGCDFPVAITAISLGKPDHRQT